MSARALQSVTQRLGAVKGGLARVGVGGPLRTLLSFTTLFLARM